MNKFVITLCILLLCTLLPIFLYAESDLDKAVKKEFSTRTVTSEDIGASPQGSNKIVYKLKKFNVGFVTVIDADADENILKGELKVYEKIELYKNGKVKKEEEKKEEKKNEQNEYSDLKTAYIPGSEIFELNFQNGGKKKGYLIKWIDSSIPVIHFNNKNNNQEHQTNVASMISAAGESPSKCSNLTKSLKAVYNLFKTAAYCDPQGLYENSTGNFIIIDPDGEDDNPWMPPLFEDDQIMVNLKYIIEHLGCQQTRQ